jgi:aspartyl-tRNA(Asn)/glutamyl-tRNA(Gln) amidotransferase subunit B
MVTGERELADYFELAVKSGADPKKVSNWIMTELMRELKGEGIATCRISAQQLAQLLLLIEKGTISGKIAKGVFQVMFETGKDPEIIVREKNLVQVSDEGEIMTVVQQLVEQHPEQARELREGKDKLMGFFVGQLMKQMKGKANPGMANALFRKAIFGDEQQ